MKSIFEQVKGLGAWYVAASELGRDRVGMRVPAAEAPKPLRAAALFLTRGPTSGLMTLRAVRERDADTASIVDFEWVYVSSLAAHLLDRDASELLGHRLLEVLQREGVAIFEHYRCVLTEGARDPIQHEHRVGETRVLRHNALRLGAGVLVTLTDMSASRKPDASRLHWSGLDELAGAARLSVQAGK